MPWQEITFTLDASQAAAYEDALTAAGALSVTLRDAQDQPILEPAPETTPLWDQLLLTAMFDTDVVIDKLLAQLKTTLETQQLAAYQVQTLQDREWRLTWKEHFKPMRFGKRLWICPSGYDKPTQTDAVVIDLDPGLAFGTGSHPTTALCLQWLDHHSVKDKTVIDYGCGSGILAIAAAKLGARQVIAVDNDPQALQATMDNARSNAVDSIITAYLPGAAPASQADVLLANILLEPLLELAATFAEMLEIEGDLIMSGILQTQQEALIAAYANDFSFGADGDTCEQQEEWVRLHATRKRQK